MKKFHRGAGVPAASGSLLPATSVVAGQDTNRKLRDPERTSVTSTILADVTVGSEIKDARSAIKRHRASRTAG